jgi:hypothetical protein
MAKTLLRESAINRSDLARKALSCLGCGLRSCSLRPGRPFLCRRRRRQGLDYSQRTPNKFRVGSNDDKKRVRSGLRLAAAEN